ncbi:MAG: hypothetical protein ACR2ID_06740 [Chthoniobacterales bacterium]
MRAFEENLEAWLAGRLQGKELDQFEASLPELSVAELEAQPEADRIGTFLKSHLGAPALTNEDFFNHQLRTEIEGDTRTAPHHDFAQRRQSWWSIGRLVWTGAASLAAFALCTFYVMREDESVGQSAYLTQIINARVDPALSNDATITMFESKEEKATVVWIDGLQSLPSEYAAR